MMWGPEPCPPCEFIGWWCSVLLVVAWMLPACQPVIVQCGERSGGHGDWCVIHGCTAHGICATPRGDRHRGRSADARHPGAPGTADLSAVRAEVGVRRPRRGAVHRRRRRGSRCPAGQVGQAQAPPRGAGQLPAGVVAGRGHPADPRRRGHRLAPACRSLPGVGARTGSLRAPGQPQHRGVAAAVVPTPTGRSSAIPTPCTSWACHRLPATDTWPSSPRSSGSSIPPRHRPSWEPPAGGHRSSSASRPISSRLSQLPSDSARSGAPGRSLARIQGTPTPPRPSSCSWPSATSSASPPSSSRWPATGRNH